MREIVLASASPRRSELLKQINLDFKVIPSTLDET
ncbi:MAG: Maf family protein, partial [Bacteroidota bacterium]|nr:Maf family protein [Bacteroidota bacterium]